MPKLDLFLLPFLGGYLFLTHFSYSRFYLNRLERQRMIFTISIWSVVLSIFFLAAYYLLSQWAFARSIFNVIYEINPLAHLGLNKSLGIFWRLF